MMSPRCELCFYAGMGGTKQALPCYSSSVALVVDILPAAS